MKCYDSNGFILNYRSTYKWIQRNPDEGPTLKSAHIKKKSIERGEFLLRALGGYLQ